MKSKPQPTAFSVFMKSTLIVCTYLFFVYFIFHITWEESFSNGWNGRENSPLLKLIMSNEYLFTFVVSVLPAIVITTFLFLTKKKNKLIPLAIIWIFAFTFFQIFTYH